MAYINVDARALFIQNYPLRVFDFLRRKTCDKRFETADAAALLTGWLVYLLFRRRQRIFAHFDQRLRWLLLRYIYANWARKKNRSYLNKIIFFKNNQVFFSNCHIRMESTERHDFKCNKKSREKVQIFTVFVLLVKIFEFGLSPDRIQFECLAPNRQRLILSHKTLIFCW